MPSPIGHSITGYTFYYMFIKFTSLKLNKTKKICLLLWFVLLANLPDLDFIRLDLNTIINISFFNHTRNSHSLIFFLIFCIILYFFVRKIKQYKKRFYFISCFALLFHLVFDTMIYDPNPTNGIGIPLFYPLSNQHYQSPILLFTYLDKFNLFSMNNFCALFIEILISLLFFLMIYKLIDYVK